MKQLFLSITTLLLISATANAKIWRMNNNATLTPSIKTDFLVGITLQQAHDSSKVVNGDTIHLEQSPANYGDCNFTKRLILIGSGFMLSEPNPNTQVNTSNNSKIGTITLHNGGAVGSQLLGVQTTGVIYAGVSNLTIRNCYTPYIWIGNSATVCDNISIIQNFIESGGYDWAIREYNAPSVKSRNLRIIGNIIYNYYGITYGGNFEGIIKNNTITGSNLGGLTMLSVHNTYVVNNITTNGNNSYPNGFTNCVVENNLGYSLNAFVSPTTSNTAYGPGNLNNITIGFVTGGSRDGNFNIQNSSPAYLTGKGGISMGAFAGDYPYRLSGVPPVPNVYQLSIGTIAPAAATMSVTVSSKSNN